MSAGWVGSGHRVGWVLALGVLTVGAWAYMVFLFDPAVYQANTTGGLARGPYFSDLYETWLGTHELLWNGRDPYSPTVTADIQRGVWGRVLAPHDPITDQMKFVYPLHVVYVLAPLTVLPFAMIQPLFYFLGLGLAAFTVWACIKAVGWRLDGVSQGAVILLAASALTEIFVVMMQQPALLVGALLFGAAACLTYRRYGLAGMLLALATIKPQLSGLVVLWLLVWAALAWRERGRLVLSFGATLTVLLAGTFVLLPDWVPKWLASLGAYQAYAPGPTPVTSGATSLLTLGGGALGGVLLVAFTWYGRRAEPGTFAFGLGLALVGLYTIVLFPGWALTHECLVYPAGLLVLQQRERLWSSGGSGRVAYLFAVGLLLFPWLLATALVGAWAVAAAFGDPAGVARYWPWPWVVGLVAPMGLLLPLGLLVWRGFRRGFAS